MILGARRRRTVLPAAALVAVAALLAGCGSSSSGGSAPSSSAASSAAPSSAAASASANPAALPSSPGAGKAFYVSIGDSYASGYQPSSTGGTGVNSTAGFAYQLADRAKVGGKGLTLVNFACAGATTTSLVKQNGCGPDRLGPGALNYPTQSQAEAAIDFVKQHRGEVALITISISGNDITSCAKVAADQVASCITTALATVKTNLGPMLKQLRAAAGDSTKIVGLTYPDVILGYYVSSKPSQKSLAPLSVTAFRSLVNPALKTEYDSVGATFVDVTALTGAYTPFTQTTTLAPYGTIPVAVANVCKLTWFCQFQNIHPRDAGYAEIADLIEKAIA